MASTSYQFQSLSTREGFNRSLRHFRFVTGILPDLEEATNLSDLLNAMLEQKRVTEAQLPAIVNALLVDRYGYVGCSHNMTKTVNDLAPVAREASTWTAVDLVVTYHHPDLGIVVINPKNVAAWASVQELRRNELVSVYAGAFGEDDKGGLFEEAARRLIDLVEGKKAKTPARFKGGKFKAPLPGQKFGVEEDEEPAPAAAAGPGRPQARTDIVVNLPAATAAGPSGAAPSAAAAQPAAPAGPPAKRRMTPMISIPVTNELFHNGNVEAWKRIIQSYTTKYPGLEVFVFYDGERIQDLNTLFKWGKVKHGSSILVSVAGDEPKDVPKLRRYLSQGASSMFEAFLKFPVNTILPLF
jgi:hypothetical protein